MRRFIIFSIILMLSLIIFFQSHPTIANISKCDVENEITSITDHPNLIENMITGCGSPADPYVLRDACISDSIVDISCLEGYLILSNLSVYGSAIMIFDMDEILIENSTFENDTLTLWCWTPGFIIRNNTFNDTLVNFLDYCGGSIEYNTFRGSSSELRMGSLHYPYTNLTYIYENTFESCYGLSIDREGAMSTNFYYSRVYENYFGNCTRCIYWVGGGADLIFWKNIW